jgi:FAD/FMN-containing dehydrogenase
VDGMNGSISAEHGIGLIKRDELARYKDPVALDLMRTLKRTLDPHNILNPGKVLAPEADPPSDLPSDLPGSS